MSRAVTGLIGVEEAAGRDAWRECAAGRQFRLRRMGVTMALAVALAGGATAATEQTAEPAKGPSAQILGMPVDIGSFEFDTSGIRLEHEPQDAPGTDALEAPLLMVQPRNDREAGTAPTVMGGRVETPRPSHTYIRVGALLRFPEDVPLRVGQATDEVTLGWGGGLNAAIGRDFAMGAFRGDRTEGLRPRLELEYQLLLADYRGQTDVGYTQNSLGVNAILTWEAAPGFRPYAGLGGGGSYVTFSRLAAQVGGDEFTWYAQILGGMTFRFDRYTEIDLGIRYKHTAIGVEGIDDDLGIVILNVGLIFHLH